jgi:hypothetical protein
LYFIHAGLGIIFLKELKSLGPEKSRLLKKNTKTLTVTAIIAFLFTAGCAFFIQPATALSVPVLSSRGYLDSINAYHVYGEAQNLEAQPIEIEKVTATFYDSGNNVIAVQDWHIGHLAVVFPNQKSPIQVLLWNSTANQTQQIGLQVDHFSVAVTSSFVAVASSPQTNIISYNSSSTSTTLSVTGTVENAGNQNANGTAIFITCYDSSGKVLITGGSYTDSYTIPPGQGSAFSISIGNQQVTPLIVSYALVAQPTIYVTYPTPSPSPTSTSVPIPEGLSIISVVLLSSVVVLVGSLYLRKRQVQRHFTSS